jgi:dipeptidyl-peptidase-4
MTDAVRFTRFAAFFCLALLLTITMTSATDAQAVTATATAAEKNGQLTVERIFADPALTGASPRSVKISPDGQWVTFLKGRKDDQSRLDLWAYRVKDGHVQQLVDSMALSGGEESLSDEEKARRERMRLYARGIVSYFWGDDSQTLLFPLAGDVYVYDLRQPADKAVRRLTRTDSYETDVKLSPDGKKVSFVRDQNLYVVDVATGKERPLTKDGGGPIKNGMAEFVAQEEMDRMTGYWWSPDSRQIAFTRVDESPVNIVKRYEINADDFTVFEQRYPATGTPNVKVQLKTIDLASGQVTDIDLGTNADIYLPRVKWLPDSKTLSFQRQSRDQKTLELFFADSHSGQSRRILTEQSPTWVNLSKDLHFLEDGRFVWSSERSGYRHLYLYAANGQLIRPLTAGNWVVNRLYGVDEKAGWVYFDANRETPLEQHAYRARLDTQTPHKPERITREAGQHALTFAANMHSYVDHFSALQTPPKVTVHRADGEPLFAVEENALDASHPYFPYLQNDPEITFGQLTADDGQTLYYRLIRGRDFDPGKKHPVLIYHYGGPHAQLVKNQWPQGTDYWLKMMAQRGYVVFTLDNRGSWNRGKAFEDPIYRRLGKVEVADQAKGVEFLRTQPWVDPARIGVFGWSYGGYMALMNLMQHPELYAAGVAVAPVTDWTLYDTHYTERYLGTPQDNPEGYEKSNVFAYASQLQDPLLMVHGMADDNVLFTNSTKLYKTLQDLDKPFAMMNYPGSKHSIWGQKTRTHLFHTLTRFFDRHLKNQP